MIFTQLEIDFTAKKQRPKRLIDRRARGGTDDPLVTLLEFAARDRRCDVYQLVDELLWDSVKGGKLRC